MDFGPEFGGGNAKREPVWDSLRMGLLKVLLLPFEIATASGLYIPRKEEKQGEERTDPKRKSVANSRPPATLLGAHDSQGSSLL